MSGAAEIDDTDERIITSRRVTRTEVARLRLGAHPLEFALYIGSRLDEAGLTLARLRMSGAGTGMRLYWPEIVRQIFHDEPPAEKAWLPTPSSAQISQMDEVFGWLPLLPDSPHHLRSVVLKRLIINGHTERHRYSWRRLGDLLGCTDKTVKRWHGDAIAMLAVKIAFMKK